jgi:hypothetical protein
VDTPIQEIEDLEHFEEPDSLRYPISPQESTDWNVNMDILRNIDPLQESEVYGYDIFQNAIQLFIQPTQ